MTTHALNYPFIEATTRRSNRLRPLDVLVVVIGIAVAGGGFLASEITWMLAQL